ncbi:MAG: hypothetical protein JW874_11915 [Spirochaetales bacterium]|nr:hypothetical protein [Spirochaetales bacterium]
MDEFKQIADGFRHQVEQWDSEYRLSGLACYNNTDYELVRTIVYNSQFDTIIPSEIKLILVGDNPGMEEQKQNAYLVGKSGKMAAGFFGSAYGYEFYRNVLILNKTPLHTKSTVQLAEIRKKYPDLVRNSQEYMARLIYSVASLLEVPVFITGFAGCRDTNGKWLPAGRNGQPPAVQTAVWFFREIRSLFAGRPDLLFLFKHFSYGNFSRDLQPLLKKGIPVQDAVRRIGSSYASELLGSPEKSGQTERPG